MKKNPEHVLFILVTIIVFSSCSKCYQILGGMKNPHLETQATLTKYMNQHQIDSTITLVAKDTFAFEKLIDYLNPLAPILIFNKDGYLNIYADKRYCSGPVENYVKKVCTANIIGVDSSRTEKNLLALLKPFPSLQNENVSTHPDYSIYLTWTMWYNKMNDPVFRWRDLLEKQSDCKTKVQYINYDQRSENYGFNKRKKMNVSLHINKHNKN